MEIKNNEGLIIPFSTIDCTDKVIVLKVPNIKNVNAHSIKNLMKDLDEILAPKDVIAIGSDVDFEAMNTDDAVNLINDYIDELHSIKEKLLGDEDDE